MNAPVKGSSGAAGKASSYGDDEGSLSFDIPALLRTLRKRASVIVGVTALLTALIAIAVFQLQPQYTATTAVLLDAQKIQVVDMDAVAPGLSLDRSTAVESEVQILKSRNLARRVVEAENLTADPEFNSRLDRADEGSFDIGGLISGFWPGNEDTDENAGVGEAGDAAAPREALAPEVEAAVGAVLSRMDVVRRPGSLVIDISFRSPDPAKAARISGAIADAYVLDQLEAKFDATKQANEWLARRLDDLRAQVMNSERAVEIYRTEHGLEESGGITVGEQQLSELNAQLILARASLVEARAKYDRAQQLRRQGQSVESVADVLQSGTIASLRQKQADLAREKANLSAKYGPRHPAVVNNDAQREDVARQIGTEINRIIESIRNNVSVAEARVNALQGSLKQIKGETGTDNQALIQLRDLERESAANRAVYESFLGRFKETTEQQNLQMPDTRIISAATVPSSPSFPRTGMFIGAGFVLSLIMGVGAALLLEELDNGIQTAQQVEELLRLPHLVSLPAAPAEKGPDGMIMPPQDYLLAKPLSAFSESLRSLRSALQLSNVDNPPKIILFTSALPSEGKTTTSASFARAAAASGLKVVLVDCDLRHPSVHRAFNLETQKEGLVELLAERLDTSAVIIRDTKSELDIIPVATGTANPPDVLGSSQMKLLLQRLRETYDLVVLDSAPLLPVSDSRVLSRLADETVFVVRWNETPRDAAQNALKELRQYDASIAGVVLAVVDTNKQARYGYGDGGYYYSRYSKYYVN